LVVARKRLKERSIYVYLPSVEMAERWKGLAEKSGRTISKFVAEHVENSLRQEEEGSEYRSRAELIRLLREKDEEISKLQGENRLMKELAERLDHELRRYRMQPFMEGGFQGVRSYDRELVDLLRREGVVDSDHVLSRLGIDPKEKDVLVALDRQLASLEAYGLVEATPRGWRWKG
jgi:predicted DNA-binding protein